MRRRHKNQPVEAYVQETLYAADPFYRGPHQSRIASPYEPIRELDPFKTVVDLGRIEPDADGAPHYVCVASEFDMIHSMDRGESE